MHSDQCERTGAHHRPSRRATMTSDTPKRLVHLDYIQHDNRNLSASNCIKLHQTASNDKARVMPNEPHHIANRQQHNAPVATERRAVRRGLNNHAGCKPGDTTQMRHSSAVTADLGAHINSDSTPRPDSLALSADMPDARLRRAGLSHVSSVRNDGRTPSTTHQRA